MSFVGNNNLTATSQKSKERSKLRDTLQAVGGGKTQRSPNKCLTNPIITFKSRRGKYGIKYNESFLFH